jgi:hypothetical protein
MWLKLLLFLLIVLFLFSLWQHKMPHKAVIDMAKGIVAEDPQTLADGVGIDLDTYTLARIAQSEKGLSSDRAKIAVMYAAKNHASRQGKSITEIATRGNKKRTDYAEANGHYGRQGIHPYCSTIAATTGHTISLALAVADGTALDETQDAQWWDNPHTQDILATAYPKNTATGKGYYTSAQIAERRIAKGATLVNIDGISTRFWA